MAEQEEDVTLRFMRHEHIDEATVVWIANMRRQFAGMAHEIQSRIPPCREKELAQARLEEALFWARAAVSQYYERPAGFGDEHLTDG